MPVVLVADDDESVLGLVAATLAVAGIDTRTFTTGADALAAVLADPPDCVVLDVTMPGPTGLDLCTTLRADHRTSAIPVILLTGMAQKAEIASGFDSGADDYVLKPFDPDDLLARVNALLSPVRQQRWLREAPAADDGPTLAMGGLVG